MPKASAPNAPCVAVWLSPQTIVMPGCVQPSSGPITCTMPWFGSCRSYRRMPNSRQFFRSVSICCLEIGSTIGSAAVGGGHVVIGRGHGPLGPADLAAGQPQPLERLGAGHLVDQLQVDVENRLFARLGVDDVVVPDLLEHRSRRRRGTHRVLQGREKWDKNQTSRILYYRPPPPAAGWFCRQRPASTAAGGRLVGVWVNLRRALKPQPIEQPAACQEMIAPARPCRRERCTHRPAALHAIPLRLSIALAHPQTQQSCRRR